MSNKLKKQLLYYKACKISKKKGMSFERALKVVRV